MHVLKFREAVVVCNIINLSVWTDVHIIIIVISCIILHLHSKADTSFWLGFLLARVFGCRDKGQMPCLTWPNQRERPWHKDLHNIIYYTRPKHQSVKGGTTRVLSSRESSLRNRVVTRQCHRSSPRRTVSRKVVFRMW